MRTLVFGGRHYHDKERLYWVLDNLEVRPTFIISGTNKPVKVGADNLACHWARARKIPLIVFPAKWHELHHPDADIRHHPDGKEYDAAAGRRRNQQMIDEGNIEQAIEFPGHLGTYDMRQRCLSVGIVPIDGKNYEVAK